MQTVSFEDARFVFTACQPKRKLAKGASPFGTHVHELLLTTKVLFSKVHSERDIDPSPRPHGRPTTEGFCQLCPCGQLISLKRRPS
jgi:hypothetical protein